MRKGKCCGSAFGPSDEGRTVLELALTGHVTTFEMTMRNTVENLRPGQLARAFMAGAAMLAGALTTFAQSSLPIYTDSLVNGWENWSWDSTNNVSNTSPVHTAPRSIRVNAAAWGALSLHHSELDMNLYSSLSFWIHGGSAGGQQVQVVAEYGSSTTPGYPLLPLTANQWQHYDIPLTTLGVATVTDLHRLSFQLTGNGSLGAFYFDDMELTGTPIPTVVHIQVDAGQSIRTVDNRWFGVNTAIWDGDFEKPATIPLLQEMGTTTLRFPGGSLSDLYHWQTGTSDTNTWQWVTSFADFTQAATNLGAEVFITVNYGTGTPEEAAGWVRHANITNSLNFKYWEIGNENYGTWEADTNPLPNHAYTYATRAQQYIAQMKAADPSIKIGVVAVPGEDSYQNGYTDHPAYNPRTGQTHYGWTPVLLTTLKSLGVTPDFVVHHHYPQWTDKNNPGASPDDDETLLQSTGAWATHAADLRQQIEDYFGPGGTNIELVVTENNSDAGAQGRQSTSLVNGLYYADSLGELMKTEFNAFIWWDLRNSTDTEGYFGPDIYGWRNYGDLGMINNESDRHPTFYAAKLIQHLARAGDTVVQASSDYSLLSCHAVSSAGGDLALLVLNKSLTTNLNGGISVSGFAPESNATVRSYGIPQDEAARTGGPLSSQDIATTNFSGAGSAFSYNFPPLSMTLFTLGASIPEPPVLKALPVTAGGQFVFELQGQDGVTYTIEKSLSFPGWTPDSTNTLVGSSMFITNNMVPGAAESWRAVAR